MGNCTYTFGPRKWLPNYNFLNFYIIFIVFYVILFRSAPLSSTVVLCKCHTVIDSDCVPFPSTVTIWGGGHPLSYKLKVGNGVPLHRICEAQTLGNSLNVGLRAGYLSVCTTGGTSDRHWLKVCLINGLTYLLTYLCHIYFNYWYSDKTINDGKQLFNSNIPAVPELVTNRHIHQQLCGPWGLFMGIINDLT